MTNEEILAEALKPKSDTLAGDDLLTGPRTIRITGVSVSRGSERPLSINFENDEGRPWKPCKTTGRTLVTLWGGDFEQWVGRYVELHRDPEVIYGGEKIGGVRIKSVSHIPAPKEVGERLNSKQIKKRKIGVVKPPEQPAPAAPQKSRADEVTENLIDRIRTEDLDAFEADPTVIKQRAWLAEKRPELSAKVDAAILEAASLMGAE